MTSSKQNITSISLASTRTSAASTKVVNQPQTSTAASSQKSLVNGVTTPQQDKVAEDAWQKRLGAAQKMWTKLSQSELKKSAGAADKLAELVQKRYSISRPDADKQVKKFIDNRG